MNMLICILPLKLKCRWWEGPSLRAQQSLYMFAYRNTPHTIKTGRGISSYHSLSLSSLNSLGSLLLKMMVPQLHACTLLLTPLRLCTNISGSQLLPFYPHSSAYCKLTLPCLFVVGSFVLSLRGPHCDLSIGAAWYLLPQQFQSPKFSSIFNSMQFVFQLTGDWIPFLHVIVNWT